MRKTEQALRPGVKGHKSIYETGRCPRQEPIDALIRSQQKLFEDLLLKIEELNPSDYPDHWDKVRGSGGLRRLPPMGFYLLPGGAGEHTFEAAFERPALVLMASTEDGGNVRVILSMNDREQLEVVWASTSGMPLDKLQDSVFDHLRHRLESGVEGLEQLEATV